MKIAIDFDGTCVSHEFPKVGSDIGAAPVLKALVANGHQLILFTMRGDNKEGLKYVDDTPIPEEVMLGDENYLTMAVHWFKDNGIPLYGIQKDPGQDNWTSSPKCYAQLYIDDAALGIPLKHDISLSARPYVDWEAVQKLLKLKLIL